MAAPKKNPTKDPVEQQIFALYHSFLGGLKTALEADSVSDTTLKIAIEFFKNQKVDYRDIGKMTPQGNDSFDLTVAAGEVPFAEGERAG